MACGAGQLQTAIGCIPTDVEGFVGHVLTIAVGLGGVVAIGLLAYGGFTLLTSSGEPEKLMEGREIITNALMGLALIALSVFVLQLIGIDLLGISELSGVV